jgi:hypothetical protein
LRPRAAKAGPEVDAFRAGQHGIEQERGKESEVGGRRRVVRRLQVRRRPFAPDRQAPLSRLFRLDRPQPFRRGPRGDAAKVPLDLTQGIVGVDVADDDERRVVGNVEASVMTVQVVARHRLEIGQPANGRMTIGMRLERRRRDLLIEEDVGIVLPTLKLRDDDRALRLAVIRVIQAAGHPLRFDEQHAIEGVARRRLQVRRLVDPRVAVPASAELLDDALHLVAGDVLGPLEVHVLDPVGGAGESGALVPRADLVPAPHGGERRRVLFPHQHLQTVVERRHAHSSL